MKRGISALLFLFVIALSSCAEEEAVPKPIGYFRIDLPGHSYQKKDLDCPFSVEISKYSRLETFEDQPCWFNIYYPDLDARIHITYRPVAGNLRDFLEEAHNLAFEHQIKANSIKTQKISRLADNVYGLAYNLEGSVATPYQFYLTDSTDHFLRGSAYFNTRPNPDSLKPALAYLQKDMAHFLEHFEWKE
ncbi:MAG: gliding motility lipoprotein GldD [Cryomorphaceae bacterium]|nr:gliding motility lipoprotein GldD [Flavobacteriales bacterium]